VDSNPNEVLAWSEAQQKSSELYTDSDPDTIVEWIIVWKIEDQKLKENMLWFSVGEILFSDVQVPELYESI
jgi:hypothetical protein